MHFDNTHTHRAETPDASTAEGVWRWSGGGVECLASEDCLRWREQGRERERGNGDPWRRGHTAPCWAEKDVRNSTLLKHLHSFVSHQCLSQ